MQCTATSVDKEEGGGRDDEWYEIPEEVFEEGNLSTSDGPMIRT